MAPLAAGEPVPAQSNAAELMATSWGAKREMKEQRARADRAEAEANRLLAEVAHVRKQLEAKTEHEANHKKKADELSKPFLVKADEATLLKAQNEALKGDNHDLRLEVESLRSELQEVQQQVAAILHVPGNSQKSTALPPQASALASASQQAAPAAQAAQATTVPAAPATGGADAASLNKRARAAKRKEEMRQQAEVSDVKTTGTAIKTVKTSAAKEAEARLAARIAEERRLQEASRQGPTCAAESDDGDDDAAERERVLREDEEREARRAAQQAAAEEEARERERQRRLRAEERRRAAEEEKQRLAQEQKTLPKEDFEALQLLRAEVQQPDAEQSPDEDDDEEAILEREMRRAEKEAKEMQHEEAKPKSFMDLMMHMSGVPVIPNAQEAVKAKQRSALKEKLRAKRELQTLMVGPSGKAGRL